MTFDYIYNTAVEIYFPDWMTETESVISVSDQYIYAMNIVDVDGMPGLRRHGANLLNVEYNPSELPAAQITNLVRVKIMETRLGKLDLLSEKVISTNIITL